MPVAHSPAEHEQVKVEFFVQVLTAEAMVAGGKLSCVDEVFTGKALRRYWNEVACGSKDEFLNRLMVRGVQCCVEAGGWDDGALRPVLETIIGGLLFGAHAYPVLGDILNVVAGLGGDLKGTLAILQHLYTRSTPPATHSGDLTHPVTPHTLSRLLLVYESLILRCTFHPDALSHITGVCFAGLTLHDILTLALGFEHELLQCCALRVVAALCIANPLVCADLSDVLSTAAYLEEGYVSELGLAVLWDVAFLHRQLEISLGVDEDSGLAHILSFLNATSVTKQRITAFGICRLLLHEPLPNPEYLLSLLAGKVTSPNPDPLLKVHIMQFLERYHPSHSESLANAVVYLSVELHEQTPLPGASLPASVCLLLGMLDSVYVPRLADAIHQNLTDFFGSSPPQEAIKEWLS